MLRILLMVAVTAMGHTALRPVASDPLRIELRIVRTGGSGDPTFVSGGIPLPPGALTGRDLDRVRVVVDGVEQSAFVGPLSGHRRDGSLRSILVQFAAPLQSRPLLTSYLEIGEDHGAARLQRRSPQPDESTAIALPASSDYLVSTGIVGPTITTTRSRGMGPAFRSYEDKAASFALTHWQQDGARWAAANYYDRALNLYALWARTGLPVYWRWATAIAIDYRDDYLERNRYRSSPHWSQLEGVALHYWLTGDDQSRRAVIETARSLSGAFPARRGANPAYQYNEGRIQQRVMLACLLAWSLDDSSEAWGRMADAYVENWLALQRPDGSFRYRLATEDPHSALGQSNFMEGLRIDALIKYYETRRADPRVLRAIQRQLDYLWATQWDQQTGTFRYHDAGGGNAAPDLNLLLVAGFGFVFRHTGLTQYRQRGDEIFQAGVSKAYYKGSKQYNEQQYDSFRYLRYRLGADTVAEGSDGPGD